MESNPTVKCNDCADLVVFIGGGIHVTDCFRKRTVIDPDIERECEYFKPKEEEE